MKILSFVTPLIVYGLLLILGILLLISKGGFTIPYKIQAVLTGSMGKAIPQGSLVIEKKLDSYQVGDVITYTFKNITVTHRLVEKLSHNKSIYYRTKGDANNNIDTAEVPAKNIQGKVIVQLPYIGTLLLFLKTRYGFLCFFIVPSITFIIHEIVNVKHEYEKTMERKYLRIYFFILSLITIFFAFSLFPQTYASFSDTALSTNNIFIVADIPTPMQESIANHLVIAEVQTAGSSASQDFVEIYNPTNSSILLTGWRIRKKTSGGTVSTLVTIGTGRSIPAHGFFLWANSQNGFDVAIRADVSNTNTLADNNSIDLEDPNSLIVDQLGWGNGTNQFMEGSLFPTNPTPNHSLERKAKSTSTDSTMSGIDAPLGNGYDTNTNANDFVLKNTPEPQNSLHGPEPI